MAEKRVSVRLAAVGGRQVRAELEGVGEAGARGFGRLSREMEAANARLAAFSRRVAVAAAAAVGGGVIPNDVELVLSRVLLVIGRHPHIGDGWDILSGLVAFVLAVVSTVIQIGFSFSAFFGFYFSI